jgi:hypothetical protein
VRHTQTSSWPFPTSKEKFENSVQQHADMQIVHTCIVAKFDKIAPHSPFLFVLETVYKSSTLNRTVQSVLQSELAFRSCRQTKMVVRRQHPKIACWYCGKIRQDCSTQSASVRSRNCVQVRDAGSNGAVRFAIGACVPKLSSNQDGRTPSIPEKCMLVLLQNSTSLLHTVRFCSFSKLCTSSRLSIERCNLFCNRSMRSEVVMKIR